LKNAVSLFLDKDFMNTDELKEYEKNQILDIANNNCIVSYINTEGKRLEQCVSIGCDPFH
jgi:aspartate 1-decarboxylase